jgi:hypothetical protein
MIATYCCGICTALYWGCTFGSLAFFSIWIWTPFMRFLNIVLNPFKQFFYIILSGKKKFLPLVIFYFFILIHYSLVCVAPAVQVASLIFSRIHVTNSTSDAPEPIEFLTIKH